MKNILLTLFIAAGLFSCKKDNTTATQELKEEVKASNIPTLVFEKTACFGTCPIYKAEIFEDGRMVYTGTRFVNLVGTYTISFPVEILKDFQKRATDISFFELEEKYDGNVTDLPSTITTFNIKGNSKTITARTNIPDALKDLNLDIHNKIMSIVNPNAEAIMKRVKDREELKRSPERVVQPVLKK